MANWVTLESESQSIIFGAKGVQEVIQNVKTILTTPKGTQPLDRDFGLSLDFLDSPVLKTRALAEQNCFMALRKYEPRAILKQIKWNGDILSGKLWPEVLIQVVL